VDISIVKLTSLHEIIMLLSEYIHNFGDETSSIDVEVYAKKLFENGIVLTANQRGETVGFVSFYANDRVSNSAYISLIATSPNHRNKGVGKLLLNEVYKFASAEKYDRIRLKVYKSNLQALRFYLHNSFSIVNRIGLADKILLERIIRDDTCN